MRHRAKSLLPALLTAAILSGCSQDGGSTSPRLVPTPSHVATHSPRMAIIDWRTGDFTAPETQARLAKADLVILEPWYFWSSDRNARVLDAIHALNPDVRILAYALAKTSRLIWDHPDSVSRARDPYGDDWFRATRPYWCWTTTGDTVLDWPGQPVIDIRDARCRAAMLAVLHKYRTTSGSPFDGLAWDYFSAPLWIPPAVAANMQGEIDLDGDGVPHAQDADELDGWRAAQDALVREARARFGPDCLEFANGSRTATDSTFVGLLDGMYYEQFPTIGFGQPNQMARALDPLTANNLFAARHWPSARNGGTWPLIANAAPISYQDDQGRMVRLNLGDVNRAVALLTDVVVCYLNPGVVEGNWPDVEIDLGTPLGGVVCAGDTLRREFTRGRVEVVMKSGSFPIPFDYAVWQDGALVQRLACPRHFP
jgi:hypothetical protein